MTIRASVHHTLLYEETTLAFYDTSHVSSRLDLRKGKQRAIPMAVSLIKTDSKNVADWADQNKQTTQKVTRVFYPCTCHEAAVQWILRTPNDHSSPLALLWLTEIRCICVATP
ncbi:hypothetical protein DM01DRAFT_1040921 [Hesseltinella vesiculosa]|uniref:Uncharacterized protein n=1 Tax=Hesseltinella vesiculosa TaxID=101127 RepID=A0A1X2GIL8_9FUNG|nr:hypothetical protein DM01DRAFT_1040921 [Hesseltinella vesiculosa]